MPASADPLILPPPAFNTRELPGEKIIWSEVAVLEPRLKPNPPLLLAPPRLIVIPLGTVQFAATPSYNKSNAPFWVAPML